MAQFLEATRSQLGYTGSLLSEKGQLFIFNILNTYSVYRFIFPAWGAPACTTIQGLTEYMIY